MNVSKSYVSRYDAALIAVICAILGGILSWVAFSSPDGIRVPKEAGNAADWIAALAGVAAAGGTWAIGRGANRYAAIAHLQRKDEIRERRRSERAARQRRFNVIISRAKVGDALVRLFEDYKKDRPESVRGMEGRLLSVRRILSYLKWPVEEIAMLDDATQAAFWRMQVSIGVLEEMVLLGLGDYEKGKTDSLATAVQYCADGAATLNGKTAAFIALVEAEKVRVRAPGRQ